MHARALEAGVYGAVRVFAKGTEQPSWRSVRISSGGGEGQTFVRVDLATLVVTEKQAFTLEADLTQVNLVRGGKVDVPVRIERSKDFAADIHFKVDGLPSGVTAEPLTVQKDVNTAKIRLNAGATAVAGRTKEIAVIGTAGGHTEEAPAITVQVD